MITPEEVAAADQALKLMADTAPGVWRGLYVNSVAAGFTEEEALALVAAYIQKPGGSI